MSADRSTSEFDAACNAVATFTAITRHADAKAAILAALYGAVLTLTAMRVELIGEAYEQGRIAAVVCGAGMLVSLLGAAYQLLQTVRPRIRHTSGVNRFSLLTSANAARSGWTERWGSVEAWRLAEVLSEIAVRKLRHFGRAVWWSAGSVLCFLTWLVVEALAGG